MSHDGSLRCADSSAIFQRDSARRTTCGPFEYDGLLTLLQGGSPLSDVARWLEGYVIDTHPGFSVVGGVYCD